MLSIKSLYPQPSASKATRAAPRRKNPRTVTMPDRVGPHVKLVFGEMARQRITYDEVEDGSGVRRPTIKQWRRKNRPGLESLEAVLGFLGWDFVAVPSLRVLPPEIAGELVTLARKMNRDLPETWGALIETGVQQRLLKIRADERAAILAEYDARRASHANDNRERTDKAS